MFPIPKTYLSLGNICVTPGAVEVLSHEAISSGLSRHMRGDWGNVLNAEDKAANDAALLRGERILSVYVSTKGVKFWVITEADRSGTTVLLPEEY